MLLSNGQTQSFIGQIPHDGEAGSIILDDDCAHQACDPPSIQVIDGIHLPCMVIKAARA